MANQYPFDPTLLNPPGQVDTPEPSDYDAATALRNAQYALVDEDPRMFLGATTVQYGIDDYVQDEQGGAYTLLAAPLQEVGRALATEFVDVIGAYPKVPTLKSDPDAYWFIGELWPDPGNNQTPVNHATMAFMEQFFELLHGYGYTFVNSVAYEVLNFFMPAHWKQLNYLGNPALSGWYPPSCFVRPTSNDAINYLSNVQIQVIEKAYDVGLPVRFQIGEPWWWDGTYSSSPDDKFAPCIYDPYTIAQYQLETGNTVPTPWLTNIFQEIPADQWPYIEWLRDKLGHSTNAIRDNVRNHFASRPGGPPQATLLFFTPQIMSPSSELTRVMNFPIEHWQTPNYDFVQIEDYDWIIDGRLDLVPLTFDAAYETLGYPRSITHYFVGFILNAWDYHIWPWIDKAIRMAKEANMPYIYVWSYTQAIRDSILYDDLPPAPMDVPIFDLPPNWGSAGYKVTRNYKTEILTSRGGKEQRRALRRTPRKTVEYPVLMSGSDMRRFDAFLTSWQGFDFYLPDLTHKVATMEALPPGDERVLLQRIPPWLQLGTVVLLVGDGVIQARAVDRVDGNYIEFATQDAAGVTWPAGTMVHQAMYGQIAGEISMRRLNDRVMEAGIVFNVQPGSEPPAWHPTGAPATFDGVELFARRPNWTGPIAATVSRALEQIDYGQGRTKTFTPVPFTQRLAKHRHQFSTAEEAEELDGFFTRMLGQQGVFWCPTWTADLELHSSTVAGTTIYVDGDDIPDYLANDSVLRNLAFIDEWGNVIGHKIMSTAVASGNRTQIVVSPPVTQAELDNVDKISWLVLSRLASDGITESWQTDTKGSIELSIRSLQDSER